MKVMYSFSKTPCPKNFIVSPKQYHQLGAHCIQIHESIGALLLPYSNLPDFVHGLAPLPIKKAWKDKEEGGKDGGRARERGSKE